MTFQKGTSGNPRGRPKRGAALTEFIRAALDRPFEPGSKVTAKERIASVIVQQACRGNLQAIAWLTDRMEGTAPHRVEHSGPDGGPLLQRHVVEVKPVDYRQSIRALAPLDDDGPARLTG